VTWSVNEHSGTRHEEVYKLIKHVPKIGCCNPEEVGVHVPVSQMAVIFAVP